MNVMPDLAAMLLPFRSGLADGTPPLRVGLVLDRDPPAPWVNVLAEFLAQIPGLDVHLATIAGPHLSEARRPAWLVDRLYSASRAKFDPFGDVDGKPITRDLESMDAIRAAAFGMVIWLADSRDADVDVRSLARHGVFTIGLGDRAQAIPFWDEVAGNRVTSTTTIYWHDATLTRGQAVRRAETPTSQGLFVTMNAERPLVATIRMLAALCLEIHAGGSQFEERARTQQIQHFTGFTPTEGPSNLQAARFAVTKLMRSARLRWTNRGMKAKWFVAIRPNGGESIHDPAQLDLAGFTEVSLPHGVDAMADPFLWEAGGRQYLLFEEVAVGRSRGRLGCVELLGDGSCSEMTIVLERPYHLSYPCVVRSHDDLFLIPETADAGRVDIYRFSSFPREVKLVSTPIEGVALVDTTPVFVDNHWYFFTTTIEPFMETLLFSAARLEGPWELHPCSPVSSSVRNSRSAGQLFWKEGRLFRPTQDCSVRYGYAITVNEVTRLTPRDFAERPVSHVPPSWKPGLLGTHTWNESSRWQVIDGLRLAGHAEPRPRD